MVAGAAVMAGPPWGPHGEGRRLATAALTAFLLEAALVWVAGWWLVVGPRPIARPKGLPRIELSLTVPAPVVVHPAPPPRPHPVVHPPPAPTPRPAPLRRVHVQPKRVREPKPVRHRPRVAHRPRPVHRVVRPPPRPIPVRSIPKPVTVPSPSPPPRREPAGDPSALAAWEARVRAAIQAALVYPPSARWLRETGRARVAFVWSSGVASHPRILVSSGIRALDSAALAAVRDARIPPPPGDIGPGPYHFAVWVRFSLGDDL